MTAFFSALFGAQSSDEPGWLKPEDLAPDAERMRRHFLAMG